MLEGFERGLQFGFVGSLGHTLKKENKHTVDDLTSTVGVPATSRILMGDCQKLTLSFSTLTKVPFLSF